MADRTWVDRIRGISDVVTTYGMAPASFICGALFVFFAVFRNEGGSQFTSYGGLAVGVSLMFVSIVLHVWKVSRETPRQFPPPPPLDPQFVETLALLRRLAARDLSEKSPESLYPDRRTGSNWPPASPIVPEIKDDPDADSL